LVADETDTSAGLGIGKASLREREELLLLARFLHNGILQELTAAGLQLHAIARKVPEAEARTINDLLNSLRSNQRSLRQLVDALETELFESPTVLLRAELARAAAALSRDDAMEWTSTVRPEGARITKAQAAYLMALLGEFATLLGHRRGALQFRVEIIVGSIVRCELAADAGAAIAEPADFAALQRRVGELGGMVEMTSDREGCSISASFPRDR
jgi:hypothetical protein